MKLFSTNPEEPKEETTEKSADGDENRVFEMLGDDSEAVDSTPTFLAYIRKGFWD